MSSASAMSLLGRPSMTSASPRARARSARPARAARQARPRSPSKAWPLACRASSTRSTSALLEKGFSTKSKAPRLTAATAVGTSPWPVRKITGRPAAGRVRPGVRTAPGRWCRACARPAPGTPAHRGPGPGAGGRREPGLEGIGAVKAFGQQAARAQQPGQGVAHHVFVVHQVDNGMPRVGSSMGQGRSSVGRGGRSPTVSPVSAPLGAGSVKRNSVPRLGPAAPARSPKHAAVLFHHRAAQAQAQAHAFGLGGEEGREQPGRRLGRMPARRR
jgi:hypothetical protein